MIADDHRMVAEGVSCLLEGDAQIHVAGIVCTLEEAARQMGTLTPQVLLLDVAMPDGDGIDAIPAIRTAADHDIYDLQGRRIAAPQRGLYIMNGRKVWMK